MHLGKTDLIAKMSEAAGITAGEAQRALRALVDAVGEVVCDGGRITVADLGAWHVTVHSARFERGAGPYQVMRLKFLESSKPGCGKALTRQLLDLLRNVGDEVGPRAC